MLLFLHLTPFFFFSFSFLFRVSPSGTPPHPPPPLLTRGRRRLFSRFTARPRVIIFFFILVYKIFLLPGKISPENRRSFVTVDWVFTIQFRFSLRKISLAYNTKISSVSTCHVISYIINVCRPLIAGDEVNTENRDDGLLIVVKI